MPRRSSGRSTRAAPARPAPRPVNHAPPPVPSQSGSGGSLMGVIGEGMAFGTGTAMAHRVVDSVLGPRTIHHETAVTGAPAAAPAPTTNSLHGDACNVQAKSFQDCLNSYGNDISKCQLYMDMLAECRKNTGATLSA
ncbi:hypothetical protein VNO77_22181 [Canavalia gladiata]|uniref:CHCH domain-containing protein n=1 Tax=Canavalia gladiata TaxID=3824 RepID=A0AAN9Q7S8_CANGL